MMFKTHAQGVLLVTVCSLALVPTLSAPVSVPPLAHKSSLTLPPPPKKKKKVDVGRGRETRLPEMTQKIQWPTRPSNFFSSILCARALFLMWLTTTVKTSVYLEVGAGLSSRTTHLFTWLWNCLTTEFLKPFFVEDFLQYDAQNIFPSLFFNYPVQSESVSSMFFCNDEKAVLLSQ